MDQLFPEWYREAQRWDPPRDLDYWLGEILRAPVRDIPTVEDWQREQGEVIPPDATQSREAGRGALDYLTMAHAVASLLRGGAGTAQELMGKRRGQETFGKEMMDTSRRALPQWQEKARAAERDLPMEMKPDLLGASGEVMQGRGSYRDEIRNRLQAPLAPGESPQFRSSDRLPPDVVQRGAIAGTLHPSEGYTIGTPVTLPGGREAFYVVLPSPVGAHIALSEGGRLHQVESLSSIGEALARARQLQNRLALAAKDLGRVEGEFGARAQRGTLDYPERTVRLPWERGTKPFNTEGPEALSRGPLWPYDYQPPPQSGRWANE